MLSLKYIRENIDLVKKSIAAKNVDFDLAKLLEYDKKRRDIIQEVESLKANRNIINKKISSSNNVKDNIDIMRSISKDIKKLDIELNTILSKINNDLLYVPNIVDSSVPIGVDESSNVIVREWGKKPEFDFDIKGHLELSEKHRLLDFKSASKISGSAFPLYTQIGAKYERSLINFMLDTHIAEHAYSEVLTPFIVSSSAPRTTGNLPKFKDDMYYIELDDMYCIPTAEVPVTNIHSKSILNEDELPKKYVAYSPCFRREAGSYGKDTKGLLRVHQFNKVELVQFVHPDKSYDVLEDLLLNAETILQKLNLHYRVVSLASGDLSFSAAKCYDIEVWSPFENKYLEVSSCSNFESFQARRGDIKFRSNKTNKVDFVHTLNGSGLATPRLMVALLEAYQKENSDIEIPGVLRPYLNVNKIKSK
ncbi:MAG: serine--tRNA ligase [Candidatus Marinimicrobia bacterium]|nr:serine--tRNA ligase [Candidatus Neomarinimicrobiota bacterium]|tara:strand:+ start:23713 stop:24975 length:1263 start_codon:yes stop_codon:yes gene_type:complete